MSKIFIAFLFFLFFISLDARDIKTNDGKEYIDVKIMKVKPNGIDILHEKGAGFLHFKNLPEDIRNEYNYDPVKSAEYENRLKSEKEKFEKKLAEKRRLEEENKKVEAERRKIQLRESYEKIIKKVYSEGIPVKLNRKTLFKFNSGDPIFASSKILGKNDVFPAYKQYMVVNKKVYIVKNNVISLLDEFKKLEIGIAESEEEKGRLEKLLEKNEQKLEDNISKIVELLGDETVKRSDFYDKNGKYIGSVYTSDSLSFEQNRLIQKLNLENRKLDREISIMEKDILSLESNLEKLQVERRGLKEQIDVFMANQKRYLEQLEEEKAPVTDESANPEISEDIKTKLERLKDLYEKKLIPEELYKKKVSEAIDKYMEK